MSGGCLDGVCGCLTVSGSYLGVSGRCLGEYRCHINHKQLNRSRYTKLLSFLPVTSRSQIGAKWQFHTFDWAWGFFWSQVADFCSKWLVLVHYKGLGGWHCQILIWPIYQYTLVLQPRRQQGLSVKGNWTGFEASGDVWWVSGGCLEGVWRVSGVCLDGI